MSLKIIPVVAAVTALLLHHYNLDIRLAKAIAPSAHASEHKQRANGHTGTAEMGKPTAASFEDCPQFFYQGMPPVVPDAEHLKPRAICYDAFAVYHSGLTRTPIYVAEHLTRDGLMAAKEEVRTNNFFPEGQLPAEERAELEDYQGSGYDRGHMAPAGDMPTTKAMLQSFSLANMVPQAPDNNRGIWDKSVEKAVRKYVLRTGDEVYVITGPVYAKGQTADESVRRVWVPDFLFKLVYAPSRRKAWAY